MIIFWLASLSLGGTSPRIETRRSTPPQDCSMTYKGERLFIGSGDCLSTLPRSNMSGYVILGPEEACFAPTLRLANQPCEVDLMARDGVLPVKRDYVRRLYRMTMRVAGDGRKGLYGRGGVYSKGYYVLAVKSAALIRRLH